MSSVRSSELYRYDRYAGRNYVLLSNKEYVFYNNRYRQGSTITSASTVSLSVSSDLYAHSGNGTNLRISFDIWRTGISATSASTAGVYGGVWIYFQY